MTCSWFFCSTQRWQTAPGPFIEGFKSDIITPGILFSRCAFHSGYSDRNQKSTPLNSNTSIQTHEESDMNLNQFFWHVVVWLTKKGAQTFPVLLKLMQASEHLLSLLLLLCLCCFKFLPVSLTVAFEQPSVKLCIYQTRCYSIGKMVVPLGWYPW